MLSRMCLHVTKHVIVTWVPAMWRHMAWSRGRGCHAAWTCDFTWPLIGYHVQPIEFEHVTRPHDQTHVTMSTFTGVSNTRIKHNSSLSCGSGLQSREDCTIVLQSTNSCNVLYLRLQLTCQTEGPSSCSPAWSRGCRTFRSWRGKCGVRRPGSSPRRWTDVSDVQRWSRHRSCMPGTGRSTQMCHKSSCRPKKITRLSH